MKVYVVRDDIALGDEIDKIFLYKVDAEAYCNYSNQCVMEYEVIE